MKKIEKTALILLTIMFCLAINYEECFSKNWVLVFTPKSGINYGKKYYIDVDQIKLNKFKSEIEIDQKNINLDESYDINHILINYKKEYYSILKTETYNNNNKLRYKGYNLVNKEKYKSDYAIQKYVDFVMKNKGLKPDTDASTGVNEDLLIASSIGELSTVKRFLAEGADIDAKDKVGSTALMYAANKGHPRVVQFLLDKGAEVNAKNKDGYTALILACVQNQPEVVQALIAKGAEVNAKGKDGVTALMWASLQGHREVVEALLAKGAEVNAKTIDGRTALDFANSRGVKDLLIKAGAK